MNKYFITGIGTDVGKTVISAVVTEALEADYWKPVQAGELQHADTHSVMDLVSNTKTRAHDHIYALKTPMSPHAAAEIDQVVIEVDKIIEPQTQNHLVIEGAGGLLVPLNDRDTIIDLIKKEYKIILVSRHYLGSINHTLLSINELRSRGLTVSGIIFNGNEHPTTESIIQKIGKVDVIGRINEEPVLNKTVIKQYANLFKSRLETL